MLMLMCRFDEDRNKSNYLQISNTHYIHNKASTVFRKLKLRQTRNLLEHEQINGQFLQKKKKLKKN